MTAEYVTEMKLGVTYIHLQHGAKIEETVSYPNGVNIDLDFAGEVVGIELLTSMVPAIGCQGLDTISTDPAQYTATAGPA